MCPSDIRDLENGRKGSDALPKRRSTLPPRKKTLMMDDALNKIKFGKFNFAVIFLSGMILNAVLMETCGVSFVMPVSQCDLNMTTSDKGILGAASFSGIIFSSHLWGYLSDTKGRRCVMQPTLFVAFILSVLSSFTDNFYVFVALRFLNGFFISGSSATVYAYLGEFHDGTQRARAIMGSALIFGVSCLLLPLVAWFVINQDWLLYIPMLDLVYKPWRLFLVICGLPGLLSSLAFIFLPESPKFVLGQGNQMGAMEILQKMNRWNNGKNAQLEMFELLEEAESIENRRRILDSKSSRFPLLRSIWDQTAPLFKPPYLGSTLLICFLQYLIYITSNGVYMWFPEILNRVAMQLEDFGDKNIKMCQIVNMSGNSSMLPNELGEIQPECIDKLELQTLEHGIVLEILWALGFAIIGLLINRVGKFVIMAVVLVGSGIGGVLCAYITVPLASMYSFIVLMCAGMSVNVLNAATVEIFPTSLRAMAICISVMFGRLGCVTGSNVFGLLLENHCDLAFILSGASLFAAAFFTFFVPHIHEKVSKKNISDEPRISICSRL